MLKSYKEYQGFKVGDIAYVRDLWKINNIIFLLKDSSYEADMLKVGKGEILFICDVGYDCRKEFGEKGYMIVVGEEEEEGVYYDD